MKSPGVEQLEAAGFRVLRRIGGDELAEIWLAQAPHPGDRVALKLLRPEFVARPEWVRRLVREGEVGRKIRHPNVLQTQDLLDLREEGKPPCLGLVLEYVPGETLAERLARGALGLVPALGILRAVCAGLRAAHRAGVVHRDLQPRSVLLGDGPVHQPQVKLRGFGAAKLPSAQALRETFPGELSGAAVYLAPELVAGRSADERADVYGLGALMYALLTGRPPFDAAAALRRAQGSDGAGPALLGPRTFRGEPLPPELEALVQRCLAVDPGARPASVGEVEQSLRRICGEAPEAPELPATPPLPAAKVAPEALAKLRTELLAARSRGPLSSDERAAVRRGGRGAAWAVAAVLAVAVVAAVGWAVASGRVASAPRGSDLAEGHPAPLPPPLAELALPSPVEAPALPQPASLQGGDETGRVPSRPSARSRAAQVRLEPPAADATEPLPGVLNRDAVLDPY